MSYSTDQDLIKIRSKILTYLDSSDGISIDEFHDDAASDVNIDINNGWYKQVAESMGVDWKENPYDTAYILDTSQFKDLASYKCLFLIYRYVSKDSLDADAYERQRDYFDEMYYKELARVIETGVQYDWDASGVIEEDEKGITAQAGNVTGVAVW